MRRLNRIIILTLSILRVKFPFLRITEMKMNDYSDNKKIIAIF